MKSVIAILVGTFAFSAFAQFDTGYTRILERQFMERNERELAKPSSKKEANEAAQSVYEAGFVEGYKQALIDLGVESSERK